MRLGAVVLAATIFAGAQPAFACSLPHFPLLTAPVGLSKDDADAWAERAHQQQKQAYADWVQSRELSEQVRLWEEADAVILARIERKVAVTRSPGPRGAQEDLEAELALVKWLKGAGGSASLQLAYDPERSCGYAPRRGAVSNQIGSEHVIFLRGVVVSQASVLGAVELRDLQEARALAALTAR